jgi:DNA/RNA endonuclease YhcR with UshA esterase domain
MINPRNTVSAMNADGMGTIQVGSLGGFWRSSTRKRELLGRRDPEFSFKIGERLKVQGMSKRIP